MPFLADGLDLQVNDGGAGAYADITGVITVTPPSLEVGSYDSTHLNATAGILTKEPLSRAELGTFEWTMFDDPTEYSRLVGLRGTKKNFKIVYPSTPATNDVIPAFISKVEQLPQENQEPAKLRVLCILTGAVTRT